MCGYTNMRICFRFQKHLDAWKKGLLLLPWDKGKPTKDFRAWMLSWGIMVGPGTTKALNPLLHQMLVGLCSILSSLRDPGSTFCSGCCRSSKDARAGASTTGDQRPWLRSGSHVTGQLRCTVAPCFRGSGQPVLLVPLRVGH